MFYKVNAKIMTNFFKWENTLGDFLSGQTSPNFGAAATSKN